MQNHQICEVDSHKHIGVYFSKDFIWHKHIKYIMDKTWSRINTIRKFKFRLDRKSLETIYIAFIRHLIKYGDVIWDKCTLYEKQELDKIQHEAARIARGATRLVSIAILYKEIGWDSLEKTKAEQITSLHYFTK